MHVTFNLIVRRVLITKQLLQRLDRIGFHSCSPQLIYIQQITWEYRRDINPTGSITNVPVSIGIPGLSLNTFIFLFFFLYPLYFFTRVFLSPRRCFHSGRRGRPSMGAPRLGGPIPMTIRHGLSSIPMGGPPTTKEEKRFNDSLIGYDKWWRYDVDRFKFSNPEVSWLLSYTIRTFKIDCSLRFKQYSYLPWN